MVLCNFNTLVDKAYRTATRNIYNTILTILAIIQQLLQSIYKVCMILIALATTVVIWAAPIFLLTVLICHIHEKRADRKLVEARRLELKRELERKGKVPGEVGATTGRS